MILICPSDKVNKNVNFTPLCVVYIAKFKFSVERVHGHLGGLREQGGSSCLLVYQFLHYWKWISTVFSKHFRERTITFANINDSESVSKGIYLTMARLWRISRLNKMGIIRIIFRSEPWHFLETFHSEQDFNRMSPDWRRKKVSWIRSGIKNQASLQLCLSL